MIEFERRDDDGLLIYCGRASGPPAVGLVFRVGQADESLPRRGITHLVEHLVLAPTSRTSGIGGRVDQYATMLLFEGPAAKAAEWLRATCAAIAELPVERLDVERRVLEVESEGFRPGPEAVLAELWYGARGPGLAAYPELGLRGATADDVAEHARAWFTRANAALIVVGDLRVPPVELPPGERRFATTTPARSYAALPAAYPDPGAPLALGAPLIDADAVAPLLADLLERRVWRALRHERGLAYDVDGRARHAGPHERLLTLSTDVPPAEASVAAAVLVEEVRRLAEEGPASDELAEAFAAMEEQVARVDPLPALALIAARDLATGEHRSPEQTVAELRAVTVDDVARAAGELAGRMLLACPAGASPGALPVITPFEAEPLPGRRFRRRVLARTMVGAEVVVGDEGVSALFDDDGAVNLRYADVAAAVREIDGGLTLIGESGHAVTVDPGDLRDGREAVQEIERHLDPALLVGADARVMRVDESPGRGLRASMVGEASALLAPLLGRDERLLHTAEATQGMRSGVLAISDRRLLFVAKLLSEHHEEIPLTAVRAIRTRRNPLWPALTVEHGRGTSKFAFMTVPRLRESADALDEALRKAA